MGWIKLVVSIDYFDYYADFIGRFSPLEKINGENFNYFPAVLVKLTNQKFQRNQQIPHPILPIVQ